MPDATSDAMDELRTSNAGRSMSMSGHLQDQKLARQAREDALAADILEEARVQLMLKFRFLDLALWKMELTPVRAGLAYPIGTDGSRCLVESSRVISRFQEAGDEVIRDYLHMVMHCIFRHPFNKQFANREAWSLTADILVENAVMDILGERFPSEDDAERRQAISELRLAAGKLIPQRLYKLLSAAVDAPEGKQHLGIGRSQLNTWHSLFERDDHGIWACNTDGQAASSAQDAELTDEADADTPPPDGIRTDNPADAEDARPPKESTPQIDQSAADSPDEQDSDTAQEDDSADEAGMSQDATSQQDEKSQAEEDWEDIARQVQVDLETFSSEFGEGAGELMAALAVANQRKMSYRDFLKSFMTVTEDIKVNMDEFDYIFYTYGLDLYGNMPLVEPLEYKDSHKIRDFVIVIDTSESVREHLVRRFVEHTFGILKSSEDFANKVNIHIIQADSKVQTDTHVKDLRNIDRMMDSFTVRGFGGTDFRPAFDHVEGLRKAGKLPELNGLIYFTDGLGQFPEKAPDFDTAFVFMDDGEMLPKVPPWAAKVAIQEDELNEPEGGRI